MSEPVGNSDYGAVQLSLSAIGKCPRRSNLDAAGLRRGMLKSKGPGSKEDTSNPQEQRSPKSSVTRAIGLRPALLVGWSESSAENHVYICPELQELSQWEKNVCRTTAHFSAVLSGGVSNPAGGRR